MSNTFLTDASISLNDDHDCPRTKSRGGEDKIKVIRSVIY